LTMNFGGDDREAIKTNGAGAFRLQPPFQVRT